MTTRSWDVERPASAVPGPAPLAGRIVVRSGIRAVIDPALVYGNHPALAGAATDRTAQWFGQQDDQHVVAIELHPAQFDPGTWMVGRHCGIVHPPTIRSEEHTSELQSQSNLVCRLLLEKKKKK